MRILYDRDIVDLYRAVGSLKAAARLADLSLSTIRKVLATNHEYPTSRCAEINSMLDAGMPISEICKALKKSRKSVMAHLPYVRTGGRYRIDQSHNAVKIMQWRSKKRP